jgi:hypothetical protein
LIRHLRDPQSTIRTYAARALGRIGDPRAVPPLIQCLEEASEDLVEACCKSLGRMGSRDAMRPLLRLLGEESTQRVIVAASDAVSRLGSFEAALEILPRMHAAGSPTQSRQLAVAMGNLLGQPGEFYPIVTGDSSARGMALERLQQDAQRVLSRLAAGSRAMSGPRRVFGAMLPGIGNGLRAAVEAGDHMALIEELYSALLTMCRMYAGRNIEEEEALGFAFMHSPILGLGLWFATEVRARVVDMQGTTLLEIDALLGMYFLSRYRESVADDE